MNGPPGQLDDLERAHDPATVGRQDRRGSLRVDGRQARVQGRRSELVQLGVQAGPGSGGDSPGNSRSIQRAPQVEPRSTDEDRQPPARVDRPRSPSGPTSGTRPPPPTWRSARRRAGGAGPRRARHRQLGGADVHAGVELHRVGVDDLAAQAAGPAGSRGPTCRSRSDRRTARTRSATGRPARDDVLHAERNLRIEHLGIHSHARQQHARGDPGRRARTK